MSVADATALLDGRYQLDRWIASGGFGEVWLATDQVLSRPVAVKLLRSELAEDAAALALFRAEARHAGSVAHEHIARVYDYRDATDGHAPYLVMEFVDGPSLAGLLAEGPLGLDHVLDIVAQSAAGLHAAHRAGLVHHDVKPANVLLTAEGVVKLTDFGIAQAAGPVTDSGRAALYGTPAYLAPERVTGGRGTPAADLYALGIMAYQCLTGERPFDGTPIEVALAHRLREIPPLPDWVPLPVAGLVGELTAKEPDDRPASAGEVASRAAALRSQLAARIPAEDRGDSTATLPGIDLLFAASAEGQQTGPGTGPSTGPLSDPVPGTGRRRRSLFGYSLVPVVAVAATVAALAVTGILGHGPAHPSVATQSKTRFVQVSGKALIGRPVAAVRNSLRALGLRVQVQWLTSQTVNPGTVISVAPTGRVPAGSLVRVVGALRPGRPSPGRPSPGAHHARGKARSHGHHGHRPTGPGSPGPTAVPTPSSSSSPPPSPSPSPSATQTSSPSPSASPSAAGNHSPAG